MEEKRERREGEQETEAERARREEGLEEVGRKGGAGAVAAGMPVAGVREVAVPVTRDLVRWGPVWAGLLLALPIQLLLGAIGLAVALGAYDPTAPNYAERVASTMAIWSAISTLIALFVGGYVAGRMAAVSGVRNGLVQGSIVWALAVLIGLILGLLGAAGFLGATLNMQAIITGGMELTALEAEATARLAVTGAWWFVIGYVLAWVAAAGGGMLGASARYEQVAGSR